MSEQAVISRPVQASKLRDFNRFAYNHLLPAWVWLVFAYIMAKKLSASLGTEPWLLSARIAANLAFTLIVVALFILRRPVQGQRAKPLEAVVALAGTFFVFAFGFLPVRYSSPEIMMSGNLLMLLGLLWCILSLASLGRCLGILPEARGLVTRGPFRIVRHPLYLGELTVMVGLALPAWSWLAVAILVTEAGLQIWRTYNEERALEDVFPEYEAYKARTYRLIPWVW